eukprot:14734727-Alexandrium_andersonii.AAC.1
MPRERSGNVRRCLGWGKAFRKRFGNVPEMFWARDGVPETFRKRAWHGRVLRKHPGNVPEKCFSKAGAPPTPRKH